MGLKFFAFLKNGLQKAVTKEKVSVFFDFMKDKIIEQARAELTGAEKKAEVDKAVISFVESRILTRNPIIKTLITILIEYIPVLTQCVYEYLKKYVDGLTEV